MQFKIGSFNLHNIGVSALSDNSTRDLTRIAEIIRREEFDIVALQEVLSEGKAIYSEGYVERTLLYELGRNWAFSWADAETAGRDRRHEGYAFIWNKNRMCLSSTRMENGEERIFYPRICRIKQENMFRKPYYARFTPQGTYASLPIEIRLLCVHTYFGERDDSADREIRRRELDTLLTEIYPQISERVYKDDRPSYTIVLGDYNAELYRPWHESLQRVRRPMYIKDVVIAKWDDMAVRTVQDALTTLKHTEPGAPPDDQSRMNRYAHNFDHFSFEDSDRYRELDITCQRVDAVRKYAGDDAERYKKEVSDHLPVMLSINLG